ncbi:uncharacterized protein N7482_009363 [Penicillium canariense]|uniref:Letm1 RBD domain-containing protein n=1 Tax=Penicillium canariense TaxID=189055 RepID=A0A9W9LG74_9EURO|nr:uncharacterized protein N7482_009363 [Penicillium canariense]KAJ5152885.1 hypothetical protein N7482_009363 [Penicillium canariense]
MPRKHTTSFSCTYLITSSQTMTSIVRGPGSLWAPLRATRLSYTPLRPLPLACYHLAPFSTSAASHAPKQRPRVRSASKPNLPVSTTPILDDLSPNHVNAPLSTFPAPLDFPDPLPASTPTAEKLKRLIAVGRAYLTFYKTGLKNVYHNYRAALSLRRELGLPAYFPVSPPRSTAFNEAILTSPSTPELPLGRGQFQLVRRSARDVRRMIPFTLILIICGEFTPLIVPIFGNAITPATCRVPGQLAKEREAGSKRKVLALQAHAAASAEAGETAPAPAMGSDEELGQLARFARASFAAGASAEEVLQACAVFGLVTKHDRFLGRLLVGPVYRPRLLRHLHYMTIDDRMISDAGVGALSAEEVRIAVEERGAGDVAALLQGAKAEAVEREWLTKWLEARKKMVSAQRE